MSLPTAKRFARWTAFLATLTALGAAIYAVQPQEPRWSVVRDEGNAEYPAFFSPDGNRVFFTPRHNRQAKLLVRAVLTGNELAQISPTGPNRDLDGFVFAPDRRFAVGLLFNENNDESSLWFLDLNLGEERQLEQSLVIRGLREAEFSKSGKYLAVVSSTERDDELIVRVYHTASGRLIFSPVVSGRSIALAGELLLVEARTKSSTKPQIEIWNIAERRRVGVLPGIHGDLHVVDADRKVLVHEWYENDRTGNWSCWDLKTASRLSHVSTALTSVEDCIAANATWLVLRGSKEREPWIECWNPLTGKRTWERRLAGSDCTKSPDDRYLAASARDMRPGGERNTFKVFAMPEMAELWPGETLSGTEFLFTSDSRRLAYLPVDSSDVVLRDLVTGQKQIIKLPESGGRSRISLIEHCLVIESSEGDGEEGAGGFWRNLLNELPIDQERWLPRRNDCAIVCDLQSNRERFRLQGWNTSGALLSDDGGTLITTHFDDGIETIRCWDVTPLKPLRWALGIPAGLGLLLFGLARGYTRWRNRPKAEPTPPPPAK